MFTLVSEETYEEGKIIFEEGSSGDWVYLILSGSVEVYKIINGKKVIIEVLNKGDVFGELSFIGGMKRTATVRAIADTTAGIIDRDSLDAEFNNLSSDFRSIIVAVARRFEKMLSRASDFFDRVEPRVLKTLSISYKQKQTFLKAYTGNISSGGLFIATNKPLEKGVQFMLKLQLPDLPDILQIKCEVAWSKNQESSSDIRPNGMGIKFVEMSKEHNNLMQQYLKSLLEEKS